MNKILINYLLKNFLKTFFLVLLIFYSFGVILNLFEEVEFFKNLNVSFMTPLILTSIFIPSMLIKILPFIIFISSMWFMLKIRNNKDLLTLKVFGYSNLKIFFILALTSFILGWFILIVINPITSSMSKYYEITKSNYSRDIDHLVTFNKNGLWIKENLQNENNSRIISAFKPEGKNLLDVTIFHLDKDSNLIEKIVSKEANIQDNKWLLSEVTIFKPEEGILKGSYYDNYEINSIYNYEKINSLFKNFDTMSFLDMIFNYEDLLQNGYSKLFLNQSLHSLLSLPFFLLLMTALASVLTMNTLRKSESFKFIIVGLITSVIIFYFKDLSLALGQTDRIPLILSIWAPVIALSLFIFVGVLQINEK